MDENSSNNRRRANDDSSDEGGENRLKRQRKQGCVGEQLVCPITLELPFHPVTAEDGRIYERSAIEKHFRSNENNPPIKSPMTNAPMGTRLLASPQTKELIEVLIENNSITGELKEGWIKKKDEQKQRNDILKRAQDGNDAEAMFKVACAYGRLTDDDNNNYGLEVDATRSWEFMVAAHEKKYPPATACFGFAQITGSYCDGSIDVEQDIGEGGMHLGLALGCGSKHAQFMLGIVYLRGIYGFPRSPERAVELFQMGLEKDDVYDDYPSESGMVQIRQALEEAQRELSRSD